MTGKTFRKGLEEIGQKVILKKRRTGDESEILASVQERHGGKAEGFFTIDTDIEKGDIIIANESSYKVINIAKHTAGGQLSQGNHISAVLIKQ